MKSQDAPGTKAEYCFLRLLFSTGQNIAFISFFFFFLQGVEVEGGGSLFSSGSVSFAVNPFTNLIFFTSLGTLIAAFGWGRLIKFLLICLGYLLVAEKWAWRGTIREAYTSPAVFYSIIGARLSNSADSDRCAGPGFPLPAMGGRVVVGCAGRKCFIPSTFSLNITCRSILVKRMAGGDGTDGGARRWLPGRALVRSRVGAGVH